MKKQAFEIIKELRIKNGLSQKALADEIGMTQQSIALLENGKRKIEFDLFVEIAKVLKEPLVDIFFNYGVVENDLDRQLNTAVVEQFDDSFEKILEAHGAYIVFDKNDNYAVKYNNTIISLSDEEYWAFRSEICNFIEYSLDRLLKNYQNRKTEPET